MNRNVMALLVLCACLLGAVAPLMMGGCGGNARGGTETGNPPGIDTRRLRLEWTENVVELIGEPGAVAPGAEVQLRNSRTGESVSGRAGADGSIRLLMQGDLADPYEVNVSSGAGETSTPITATDPSLSTDLGTLSCDALRTRVDQEIESSFDRGSTACIAEADCVRANWEASCFVGCGDSVLSRTGESAARADAEQRTAALCTELERCEPVALIDCLEGPRPLVRCMEGSCVGRAIAQLSCQELGDEAYLQSIGAVQVLSDRACTVDADCTIVSYTTRCFDQDCGGAGAVATLRAEQVLQRVSEVEEAFCGQFDRQACPPPIEGNCAGRTPVGELRAICQDNLCDIEPTLIP